MTARRVFHADDMKQAAELAARLKLTVRMEAAGAIVFSPAGELVDPVKDPEQARSLEEYRAWRDKGARRA